MKSRKTPSCDIEFGHRTTSAALIGNIAHKTRALLDWDAKAERFTNTGTRLLLVLLPFPNWPYD